MFGNIEEQQAQLNARLKEIKVSTSVDNGAVVIEANAAREILNVSIDAAKIDTTDTEQLQDLLLVAFNKCMEEISAKELAETQELMKNMMPGLDNLKDLFG